jgi:hypothetical protein
LKIRLDALVELPCKNSGLLLRPWSVPHLQGPAE